MEEQQDLKPYFDLIEGAPTFEVQTAFTKGKVVLQSYENIAVSISGGADSDLVMDFVQKILQILRVLGIVKNVKYIFFDTGMEFYATKEHLDFLEAKYGVEIHREKAVVPVPLGVRKYGQPFFSKQVSDYIDRLQRHGFKWEDRPFNELIVEYPKCKAALRWWCNEWGEGSRFNISRNKYLKEFMVENPPTFKISKKCCEGAKKKTAKRFQKNNDAELSIQGLRKAEGGVRATGVNSCFSSSMGEMATYRPIFWFSDTDKKQYCEAYGVTHSRCYTQYGLPRTGCACCPFGSNFETELKVAEQYEPKLFKAANKVFGNSYEYTRAYRRFKEEREASERERLLEEKAGGKQLSLFD